MSNLGRIYGYFLLLLKTVKQYETYWGIPVYKCVYRYTVRIPVWWYTGIPSSYFTDIFMDFSEFMMNFRRFLADFVICSQILTNFRHLSEICENIQMFIDNSLQFCRFFFQISLTFQQFLNIFTQNIDIWYTGIPFKN